MPEEALLDFDIPWCQKIISDPEFVPVQHPSRVPPNPLSLAPTKNALFADALWTDKTIRACASFYKPSPDKNHVGAENRLLLSLGTDINGHSGICHGGIIAVIMDEASGSTIAKAFESRDIFTGSLATRFVKPVYTPAVVVCRAWIENPAEGRKVWVKCSLEGDGIVYATGESLYIKAAGVKL